MSKDEAEKWLNMVKDNNKEIMRGQILKKGLQPYYSKKDW